MPDIYCARARKLALPEFEAHNLMETLRPVDPRHDQLEVYPCVTDDLGEHFHVGHRDLGGWTRPWHPQRPVQEIRQTLGDLMPAHLRALAEGAAQ